MSCKGEEISRFPNVPVFVTARAQRLEKPTCSFIAVPNFWRDVAGDSDCVLSFLGRRLSFNSPSIFESEEDYFGSDLTLGQWVRDARQWATNMLDAQPEVCHELFHGAGEKALDRTRSFYRQHLGPDPAHVDSLDATAALIKWAKQRRGFEFSQYRAQLWEFVVEIADAALWLGWLFPCTDDARL